MEENWQKTKTINISHFKWFPVSIEQKQRMQNKEEKEKEENDNAKKILKHNSPSLSQEKWE